MKRTSKEINLAVGITGFAVFALCLTMGSVKFFKPAPVGTIQEIQANDARICSSSAVELGFSVTPALKGLEVRKKGVDGYRDTIFQASVLTTKCQGFVMSDFCLGDCPENVPKTESGVYLRLSYEEPIIR